MLEVWLSEFRTNIVQGPEKKNDLKLTAVYLGMKNSKIKCFSTSFGKDCNLLINRITESSII